jgi:hypothetical protein
MKLIDLLQAAMDLGKIETKQKVQNFADVCMIDRNPEKLHEQVM